MLLKSLIDFLDNNEIKYSTDVPMSEHTTFKIGGNADVMIFPKTVDEVCVCVKELKELNFPYYPIGNGSNLLVSDSGIRGAVIKTDLLNDIAIDGEILTVGAGCINAKVAAFAMENSLSGMEFAHGIPGSIGGAVFMNAGAYDSSFSDIVIRTVYVDSRGEVKTVSGAEHNFGYRKSCFEQGEIICQTVIKLTHGKKDDIKAEMKRLIEKRKASQPLEYPSAGSFFKRPVGYFAGKLIRDAGLKGYAVGDAQVSVKHSGFIINTGNATCADVDALSEHIKKTVYERFGVRLETEVKRI